MEENVNPSDHRIQHRRIRIAGGGGGGGGGSIAKINNYRYPVEEDDVRGGGGNEDTTIACTGKSCRSCAGGLIADCVALCCCPCAVVNILTLAFFKVPWMVGRKCLGLGKKNKKKNSKRLKKKKCCGAIDHDVDSGWGEMSRMSMEMEGRDRNGIIRKEEGISGINDQTYEFEDENNNNYSARFEAEKVWLELYQVGHLGFGRVSFTGNGIQSIGGKGNSGN